MTSEQHIKQVLTRHWGYSTFRPLQEEIILSVLAGKDTLALLPTGGGKSLCFQVPALSKDGICIVISPLIALMKDQVENLRKKNIQAVSIVSGMSRNEIDIALDNCVFGKIKFLYVSPERLSSDIFIERIQKMHVNLLAVDEAHCISQWGYDFRPAYLKIAEIRQYLPNVPVLALTATATKPVEIDIQKKLEFSSANTFKKSFERKNLSYIVLYEEDKLKRLLKVINNTEGTGIVYARTRKRTKEISDFLLRNNVTSAYYHAGLSSIQRNQIQDNWMKEKTRIVVATNAFGMGIDKPNVRIVVHVDSPDNLEAYYQEAGRAGRDEKKAYAVLLNNPSDRTEIEQRLETNFPDMNLVRNTYQALGNFLKLPVGSGKGISFDFDISEFCNSYDLKMQETFSSLKILELQGLIALNDSVGLQSRIHFYYRAQELYEFQVKNQSFDHFIKVLLRSYEGVFDDYVTMNEEDLSRRALLSKDETIQHLQTLDRLKILSYQAANDKPQLTFLEERYDIKDLNIDRENLADRKKRFIERARAFLNYAETKNRCRSQMLVNYFGETDTLRCGVCDYCLERNKANLSDIDFDTILIKVKSILLKDSINIDELIDQFKNDDEEKTMRVIEWLIDNEQIRYLDGNRLEWNKQ